MARNSMGSTDPSEQSSQSPSGDTRKRQVAKNPTGARGLGEQWRIGRPATALDELVRSVPLIALVGLAILANWSAGDVQGLVALVAPMFYLQGRSGPRGGV